MMHPPHSNVPTECSKSDAADIGLPPHAIHCWIEKSRATYLKIRANEYCDCVADSTVCSYGAKRTRADVEANVRTDEQEKPHTKSSRSNQEYSPTYALTNRKTTVKKQPNNQLKDV